MSSSSRRGTKRSPGVAGAFDDLWVSVVSFQGKQGAADSFEYASSTLDDVIAKAAKVIELGGDVRSVAEVLLRCIIDAAWADGRLDAFLVQHGMRPDTVVLPEGDTYLLARLSSPYPPQFRPCPAEVSLDDLLGSLQIGRRATTATGETALHVLVKNCLSGRYFASQGPDGHQSRAQYLAAAVPLMIKASFCAKTRDLAGRSARRLLREGQAQCGRGAAQHRGTPEGAAAARMQAAAHKALQAGSQQVASAPAGANPVPSKQAAAAACAGREAGSVPQKASGAASHRPEARGGTAGGRASSAWTGPAPSCGGDELEEDEEEEEEEGEEGEDGGEEWDGDEQEEEEDEEELDPEELAEARAATMGYGMYAGRPLRQVPASYLAWAVGEEGFFEGSPGRLEMLGHLITLGRLTHDTGGEVTLTRSTAEQCRMPFGRYQGECLRSVPEEYVAWLCGERGLLDRSAHTRALRRCLLASGRAREQWDRGGLQPMTGSRKRGWRAMDDVEEYLAALTAGGEGYREDVEGSNGWGEEEDWDVDGDYRYDGEGDRDSQGYQAVSGMSGEDWEDEEDGEGEDADEGELEEGEGGEEDDSSD
ncbi:hypothetical protein HYH03_016808 [Edaphochlamys debaryana]|uniref:Uncharacterized protein n=1 Tax=Edaphochlamys debaryana TaxID=47281 RepID=A0A836BR87_9CHLO|nr:hypothetical protein HYH03_016808 [Edaphochlamys debaryana]|eukprot:KAG2484393.1 hypothetical protein HYH03_016808 [Edaphochlamys debaryana]